MADVQEVISAKKIYAVDLETGTRTEQTGATVTVKHSITGYKYSSGATGYAGNSLEFEFDLSENPNADSKTLEGMVSASIVNKMATGSGNLPSGGFTGILTAAGSVYVDSLGVYCRNREAQNPIDTCYEKLATGYMELGALSKVKRLMTVVGVQDDIYGNVTYNASAQVVISGIASQSPPKLDAVWKDIVPKLSGLTPAKGAFVNEKADVVFGWAFSAAKSYNGTPTTQAGGKLEWRVTGEDTVHEVSFTGAGTSVTLPANSIPASATSVDWRVTVTTIHSVSTTSDWITVSTVDVAPSAPTELQPADSVVDNRVPFTFSWQHNISTGSAQGGAELQYSADGSTWTALAEVTDEVQTCEIAAGTLPSGTVQWRVRTLNSDGQAGEWSTPVTIIVRSRPPAPVISAVTATPRPTVEWQSGEQIGYRVVFASAAGDLYDTGERYGTVKSARCPGFLQDGLATVTVSICNAVGLWASSESEISVVNEPGAEINLQAQQIPGAVKLTWNTPGSHGKYYVLRNGEPVAKLTGTQWTDRAASGVNRYTVMGVTGDNYRLSPEVPAESRIRSVILFNAETNGPFIQLYKHKGSPPQISRDCSAAVSYQHFAGETWPTAFDGGCRDMSAAMSFTILHGELPKLAALIGRVVCVKDSGEAAFYAILDSVGQNVWRRTDVELKLTRVAFREQVDYE